MLCAPTMQHRTSRVKCAATAFQRCGGHPTALKTTRATRRTTHRMLWSCGLHTEYHLQTSDTKQTQKHNATTKATVAIRVRRFLQLPTSQATCAVQTVACSLDAPAVRNMQLTSMIGSNWLVRANQKWCHPLGKNTVHFPHHLDFFALPSAGARRQARTRAGL